MPISVSRRPGFSVYCRSSTTGEARRSGSSSASKADSSCGLQKQGDHPVCKTDRLSGFVNLLSCENVSRNDQPKAEASKTHQRPRRPPQTSARCRRGIIPGAWLPRLQPWRSDGCGRRDQRRAAPPFPDQEGAGAGGDRGARGGGGRGSMDRARASGWLGARGRAYRVRSCGCGIGAARLRSRLPLNNLAHELSLADPDFRIALTAIFSSWRRGDRRQDQDRPTGGQRTAAPIRSVSRRSRWPPIPAPCRWPRQHRTQACCAIAWWSFQRPLHSSFEGGAKRRRRVLRRPRTP